MRRESGRFLLPYGVDIGSSAARAPGPRGPPAAMFELIRHLLYTLYNVQGLIEWGGLLMVCGIVFVETGLFVGFFLPGDSLLVTAGVFAGAGHLALGALLFLFSLC